MTLALSAYAAGGSKATGDTCTSDDECSRGHCHAKESGDKVCVDCSAEDIENYRGQIAEFCKKRPRKCDNVPATEELPEDFFKTRIENGDRCIEARSNENRSCWAGGDDGHKKAVDDAERTRTNCYNELSTRNGNGGIYTCSDSTYSSRASDVDGACSSYGNACADFAKDDQTVDCDKLKDAMEATNKCVEAVEHLESDCLPKMSRHRERQFGDAKTAYDSCKEILAYKKDKSLCK